PAILGHLDRRFAAGDRRAQGDREDIDEQVELILRLPPRVGQVREEATHGRRTGKSHGWPPGIDRVGGQPADRRKASIRATRSLPWLLQIAQYSASAPAHLADLLRCGSWLFNRHSHNHGRSDIAFHAFDEFDLLNDLGGVFRLDREVPYERK